MIDKKRKGKYINIVETDFQRVEKNRSTSKIENQLEILKKRRDGQREQKRVLYQLRMSRQMKEDIFALLKSMNLELSYVLRNYIQTLLEENQIPRQEQEDEVSSRQPVKKNNSPTSVNYEPNETY